MEYNFFIGIDPGINGGIGFISTKGRNAYGFKNKTEKDIFLLFKEIADNIQTNQAIALIEKVHAAPMAGVSSMFTFGQSYGFLRGCLLGSGIPFEEVTPVTWQTDLKCKSGGDKNITKAKAQQLFPEIKITHGLADALLIAEFARRKFLVT